MEERLDQLLRHLNISSAQFADMIGVQRSSISHIISGRNKPSFDFIYKILLKYPEINADWLITGRGSIQLDTAGNTSETAMSGNHDLFSQSPDIHENTIKKSSDLQTENRPVLTNNSLSDNTKNSDVTNVNNVKSIIFIYEDDSFKVLNSK